MRFHIYAFVILIAGGLMFAGCARTEQPASTYPNKPEAELQESAKPAEAERKRSLAEESQNIKDDKTVTVYKSPTCGCCTMWEQHLTKAGFNVVSKTSDDMSEIRKQFGVPENAGSCHTAIVGGYVIEGHVPADDIKKLLKTRPSVAGLAAPGMPPKSPGMQPEGEKPSGYDVLSFDRQGNSKIFTSY